MRLYHQLKLSGPTPVKLLVNLTVFSLPFAQLQQTEKLLLFYQLMEHYGEV